MKLNKKLSAAITLSLMLGVYGSASAEDQVNITGIDSSTPGTVQVKDCLEKPIDIVTTAGTVSEYVGGASTTAHSFTVSAGKWTSVKGSEVNGWDPDTKISSGNSVTIAGDASVNEVYGGYIYKAGVTVENNTVTIKDSATVYGMFGSKGYIAGGFSLGANPTSTDAPSVVKNNVVSIEGVNLDANIKGGSIGAGASPFKGDVIRNKVTIKNVGENRATVTGFAIGGETDIGTAEGNIVEINGSSVNSFVYGGNVEIEGDANSNKVIISNDASCGFNVYGGYTVKGNAGGSETTGNMVTINGASATKKAQITGDVYGGYSKNGAVKGNVVGAEDKRATYFTAINIYGGQGTTGAESNGVYLSVGSEVAENVYGGYTSDGVAESNTVNVAGGTVGDSVYGGHANNGAANNNKVDMLNDSTSAYVFGGYGNTANGNIVNLANSNIISDTVGAGNIQGGFGTAGATLNQVTLNNVLASGDVYGGYAQNGNAGGKDASGNSLGNTVTITGGHIGYHAEKDEYVGVTIPGGSHLGNVYGGYVKEVGNADNNNVVISDGDIFGGVRGGKTNNGTANENIVSVSNSTTGDSVTGGNSVNSTANKNVAEITDSTIKGNVFGAWSKTGAQENRVSITGSSISFDVYGGYASDVIAKNNTVTISGDSSINQLVHGGRVYNSGNAENNSVTITGGTFGIEGSLSNVAGNIYGGRVGGYDNDKKENFGKGDAKGNSVSITGGTINGYVYGGITNEGTAGGTEAGAGNTVSIKGTDAANKVTLNGRAIGGASNVNAIGNKVGNSVSDAATNFKAVSVYGGLAQGDANKNEVYLGQGAEVSYVIGGYSNYYGYAKDNIVNINGSTIATDVVGGYSDRRDVVGNTVTISAGTIGTAGKDDTGNVIGGFSDTGGTEDHYGDAYSNVVNITGGTITGKVVGGKTDDGTAGGTTVDKGNQVNISGGSVGGARGAESSGGPILNNSVKIQGSATKVNGDVYGGYLYHYGNLVSNNVVTIKDGEITGDVFGAYAKNGTVGYQKSTDGSIKGEGNIVNLSGGSITGDVYGGKSESGYANGNKVGTEDAAATNFTAANVYGGYGNRGAEGNEVWVGTGANVTENVYGGYASGGNATSNEVTISGNSNIPKKVNGGYVYNGGVANQNTVVIEGGNTGSVTGGEVFMTASGYDNTANFNTVTISGGEIVGGVTGGAAKSGNLTKVKGFANSNNIEISKNAVIKGDVKGGHTVIGDAASNEIVISGSANVTGDVYGAFIQMQGNADSNTVTITGGKLNNNSVYGGKSWDGSASNNTVNISGTADTSAADVYGGKGTSAGTGNTLNIDTWTGTKTMKSINDFQAINVIDTREITVGDAAGLAEGGVVLSISDKDLDLTTLAKTDPSIVYLTSSGDVDFSTRFDEKSELKDSNGNVSKVNEGLWRAAAKGYGVEASKVEFQIDKTRAFVSITDDLLAGTFTDNKGNTTSNLNASGEFDLTAGAAAYEKIYGAYDARGNAQVATVNLNTAVDLSTNNSTIYGNNVSAAGNTLNVRATGSKVGGIEYFENMNFYIPADAKAGDTMVDVGSDVNLTNVNVAAGFHNDTKLNYGDKVKLINAPSVSGMTGVSQEKVADTDYTKYDVLIYQGDDGMNQVASGAKTLVAELYNKELTENAKSVVETVAASMTIISESSDMMSFAGFESAEAAIEAESGSAGGSSAGGESGSAGGSSAGGESGSAGGSSAGGESGSAGGSSAGGESGSASSSSSSGSSSSSSSANGKDGLGTDVEKKAPRGSMSIFGAVSGNKSKVKSGSHVDVKGWGINLGAAKLLKNKAGKLMIAPVVEHGRGSYDSYLNNGYHGEGDTHFVGGGIMAKQSNNTGVYYEGSLRAGKLMAEYKSTGGSYDSDSTYIAAHLGLGKVVKLSAKDKLDYYGKYYYSHQGSDDTSIHALGKDLDLHFDGVDSHRTRLGGRLSHILGAKNSVYVGFAWQHEFNSTARATIDGLAAPSPSAKGDTGIMELGWKLSETNKYDLDLGATGSVGKKKGAGLNLNFNFKF